MILQIIFYAFAIVAIASGLMVVTTRNPVKGALFLVLTFVACAALWIMAHAEFLGLILILVYVGAVMTLFLFVVMMLNINTTEMKRGLVKYLPVGAVVVLAVLVMLIIAMKASPSDVAKQHIPLLKVDNLHQLGWSLYTDYLYPFVIAGALLFVAIVAAIALAFRGKQNRLSQKPSEQVAVRRDDCVRMVQMKSEKKK